MSDHIEEFIPPPMLPEEIAALIAEARRIQTIDPGTCRDRTHFLMSLHEQAANDWFTDGGIDALLATIDAQAAEITRLRSLLPQTER